MHAAAFDRSGELVVVGSFVLSIDLGGGPLTARSRDLFLLRLVR